MQLGCFGWLLLVAFCWWPLDAIGITGNDAMLGAVIMASILVVIGEGIHSHIRISETEEAIRRSRGER